MPWWQDGYSIEGLQWSSTHGSFEDYCRERWQVARNYANKLIDAAEVVANLGTNVPIPTHESQLRPLTQLGPEDQRKGLKD